MSATKSIKHSKYFWSQIQMKHWIDHNEFAESETQIRGKYDRLARRQRAYDRSRTKREWKHLLSEDVVILDTSEVD